MTNNAHVLTLHKLHINIIYLNTRHIKAKLQVILEIEHFFEF